MATRFYLPVGGTPPTSPAFTSSWESSVSAQRWPAVRAKSNTALTQYTKRFPSTTTQQMLFHQWVSEPLDSDQTISGTISMVVKCREANAAADAHLAFVAKVMQGDSTTLVRGTLLQYHATSTEFSTTENTKIHSARAITTVNALAGDRIVIEIGTHGVTPSTSYDVQLRFGDPSATADYALTANLTTTLCPWVELSATLTFGTPTTPKAVNGTLTLAGAVGRDIAKQIVGTLTSAGSLNRKAIWGISGPLSFAGSLATDLITSVQQAIAGTLSAAGSLGLKVIRGLTGTWSGSGTLSGALKVLSPQQGNTTFGGAMNFKFYCLNAGGLSFGGMTGLPSSGESKPHRQRAMTSGHTGLGF